MARADAAVSISLGSGGCRQESRHPWPTRRARKTRPTRRRARSRVTAFSAPLLALAALLFHLPTRTATAACNPGTLPPLSGCNTTLSVTGSIGPGGSAAYQFTGDATCTFNFTTCGGSTNFATLLALYDSDCANPLAGGVFACDTLSSLSWTPDTPGPWVVIVSGLTPMSAGTFTLSYSAHCPPRPFATAAGGGYQDYPVTIHGEGSYSAYGPFVSYDWDFGDGSQGSGPTPTHVYHQQGTYGVTLQVEDSCGNTATTAAEVRIIDCDANPNRPATAPEGGLLSLGSDPPPRLFGADRRATTSPGSEEIGLQSMATDNAGVVHLVYGGNRFPPYFPQQDASIRHRAFDAQTATWGTEEVAAALTGPLQHYSVGVAADGLGRLHVAWGQRDANDVLEIHYVRRESNGLWGSPILLSPIVGNLAGGPAIGADVRGNVYVAWSDGAGFFSNVRARVWKADAQQWLPGSFAITNEPGIVATSVCVAIEEALAPQIEIAHIAWTQAGNSGEKVGHRMLMIKEPSGQVHLQATADEIPSFSPCGLATCSPGSSLHFVFDTCSNGAAKAPGGFGGPRHVIGTTLPGPPNGWPTFVFSLPERPSNLLGGVVSTLVPDRFGNIHAILGNSSGGTLHAAWSQQDSLWTNGGPVRDVPSGLEILTALTVDAASRVHAGWLDHRAPDSECSGEIYSDLGHCTPPQIPDSIAVRSIGTGHDLQLDWKPISGASACRYVIYRAMTREGAFDSVADVGRAPYVDRGLHRNNAYSYRIRPYNLCGDKGDTSAAVTAIPRFPLVFVHGCCTRRDGVWANMLTYFTTLGPLAYPPEDMSAVDYDGWGSVLAGVTLMQSHIDSVRISYYDRYHVPVDTVDIVAHSMGGILSRYYIQKLRRPVRTLITLGSPHAGTDFVLALGRRYAWLTGQSPDAMRDLSRANMKLLNRMLRDTPLTGNAWTRCTPPRYNLLAGIGPHGYCKVRGLAAWPNDGVVSRSSALYPGGCNSRIVNGICHEQLNNDVTTVAPWVRDRLFDDSLAVAGPGVPLAALGAMPPESAGLDSTGPDPFILVAGHLLHPAETSLDTVAVDNVSEASFGALYYNADATVTLRNPLGQVIDSTNAASYQVGFTQVLGTEGNWQIYTVPNPPAGAWVISTQAANTGPGGAGFATFCGVHSAVQTELILPDRLLTAGEVLPLVVRVTDGVQNLPGCAVQLRVTSPALTDVLLPALDDGAHGDGAAGDGTYGSDSFVVPTEGTYAVQAVTQGVAAATGSFIRTTGDILLVGDQLPPSIALVSPRGGETYARNSQLTARWLAWDDTAIDSVVVDLSLDDGASFPYRLGARTGADSALTWTTPDTLTSRCRLRVTAFDAAHKSATDRSPGSFRLADVSEAVVPWRGETPYLGPGYPNPFRSSTALRYSLEARARVELRIYDVAGRLVKTLVDEVRDPGPYVASWNGDSDAGQRVSSGIYFARLRVASTRLARKLLIMR